MFRICVVWSILSLLFLSNHAQSPYQGLIQPVEIKPYVLGISTQKTTNLIFPYAISSVDRGSAAILVQRAKGVDNILQLKADTANFVETNLSIVTSDAQFYSFIVFYAEHPTCLNLLFSKHTLKSSAPVILLRESANHSVYEQAIEKVSREKPFLRKRTKAHQMRATLGGIYLLDSMLVFHIRLKNSSQFTYDPEKIRFIIKSRTRTKRTAVQEIEVKPLLEPGLSPIKGVSSLPIVIGFRPFTFTENQRLYIEIEELNGGRTIRLPVKLKTLLKAKAL